MTAHPGCPDPSQCPEPFDDLAIRMAFFAAANARWSKEHPEEAARLARAQAAWDRYWRSPCGMRWLRDHDLEWAVTSGPRQTGKSCHCACHAVIQPGLVPCPSCATSPEHSSRYGAPDG